MDQDKDISTYVSALIASPEKLSASDVPVLEEMLARYPYFQALHLLLAKAANYAEQETNQDFPDAANLLTNAVLHTNGELVYEFLHRNQWDQATLKNAPAIDKDENTAIYELIDTKILSDEQEVFDEIGEIDPHEFDIQHAPEIEVSTQPEDEETGDTKSIPAIETQEDAFVLENIMSTDFFAFEESFSSPVATAPEIEEAAEPLADHEYMPSEITLAEPAEILNSETSEVTNYHDDKMPYTFLWWLAKTRKEHQTIFQPYVSLKKNNQNELQQQYVEHIFHIQSPFNPEEILNNVPEVKGDPKDLEIIENFIKRDPQIGAPRPDQIDTENKARKSAEDQNDVVSETLAKIYIEQMLYHKAIDTYDKLSLKFPEKSRYFADLIQSIKKKI